MFLLTMCRLRCDRKKPCTSCIRLGQAPACSFQNASPRPVRPRGSGLDEQSTRNTLQERIDQLESHVRSLVYKQQDSIILTTKSTSSSEANVVIDDSNALRHDFGRIDLQRDGPSYVESDHWTAILDEISDLKDMVEEHTCGPRDETQRLPGTDLFLFQTHPTSKMEIIAAIPPRIVVDSIIAKYFKSADMPVTLVVHRRVFFKQYDNFWKDPLGTPIMWVTILFGMMYVVAWTTLNVSGGLGSLDEETVVEYQNIIMTSREKMIQCLRLGNYLKGTPHTIEALLAFLQIEYVQGEDAQQGCWQLVGVIIRVALKMGYHRDGSHFPELSAFDAEMRRRTWFMLIQFDIASASQVGLPRIIKQAQCDTAEPRSLLDDDFDDTTVILPPARPQTEHTLAQFLVYKSRIVSVYGMICDFTTSSQQRNYDEAMNLDKMLSTAYAQKPLILELKPMQQSIMDGTDLITRRLYIAMTFHHAQMTLHRKFMILAKTNSKYTYSHTTCIDAALTAVRLQADLFEQCQPGRMLYADRWKILTLTQSEFLLGTTILCFNLDDDMTNKRWGTSPLCGDEVFTKCVEALKGSLSIWEQQQGLSKEAGTAVKAIRFVLAKAQDRAGNLVSLSEPHVSSFSAPPTAITLGAGSDMYQGGTISTTSAPHPEQLTSMLPDPQIGWNDGLSSELFEMDWSWDAWIQFEGHDGGGTDAV